MPEATSAGEPGFFLCLHCPALSLSAPEQPHGVAAPDGGAIRFLGEGNRVKAVVQFRGREIAHVDLGKKLLLRFAEDLAPYGSVEGQPKLEGRNAHVIISPVKKDAKSQKQAQPKPPAAPPAPAGAPEE